MWKVQIKEAEAWVQQKEGFEKFLEKQIAKREELARGFTGEKLSSSPSQGRAVSSVCARVCVGCLSPLSV
jgi:hypothetical protein